MVKAECFRTPHRRIVERIVTGSQRKHGSCGENSRRDNKNAVAQPPPAVRLDEKFLMVGLELFERRFCVDFRRVRLRLQILLERRQSRITVFANVVHQPEQLVNLLRILHCRHSFP